MEDNGGQLNDIAVVFPGQGSQQCGMLSAYRSLPAVAEAAAEVGEAIGVDLQAMIENDAEALNQTINTQPAMLAMGVGVYRAAREFLPQPLCAAGHSLGEYSALVCAGALTLAQAAGLVHRRAYLMQNAVSDGAMAALLGLEAAAVESCCEALRQQGEAVWPANYNTRQQIVIAGKRESVLKAMERLKASGAKRAVMLPMSVPSHCPLLAAAAEEFREALLAVDWQPPALPVLHCAAVAGDGGATPPVVQQLAAQLTHPVNWQQMLADMEAMGAKTVIESGPGRVLAGLGKKSGLAHLALDSADAIMRLQ